MERKNAWEKYPEGEKRDEVFKLQRNIADLSLIAKLNVNAPVLYMMMQLKMVSRI